MPSQPFIDQLKQKLPMSTGADRQRWAKRIVKERMSIKVLSDLLRENNKIALRFLWLLTDIAEVDKKIVQKELVYLFRLSQTLDLRIEASFANYWLICGVPEETEGECIDHLFKWLQSPEMNVTTKSRSLFVLFKLTEKYPELRNELKVVVEDQMDLHTADFQKRARKVLGMLN